MVFQIKPVIKTMDSFKDFVVSYEIGGKDLIVTNEYIVKPLLGDDELKCHMLYQEKFGKGEPSDEMIDAMLEKIKGLDIERVFAIGGGTVIDISKLFVFGGDYSRTERLEYEDDEYFYYVKAVPKASVSTSERSIKKINGEPIREERRSEEKKAVSFTEPTQAVSDKPKKRRTAPAPTPRKAKPVSKEDDMDEIDFEKKLEESLKDL